MGSSVAGSESAGCEREREAVGIEGGCWLRGSCVDCSCLGSSVAGSVDDETGLERSGDRANPTAIATAASNPPATKAPMINGLRSFPCCLAGLVPTGAVC